MIIILAAVRLLHSCPDITEGGQLLYKVDHLRLL